MPAVLPHQQRAGQLGDRVAIPGILYVINAAQALPVIAVYAAGGRNPPASHRRLAIWCTVLVLSSLLNILVAVIFGRNRFMSYGILPLEVGLSLWVLASWQATARLRSTYYAAIPLISVLAIVVILTPDRERAFGLWGSPLISLFAVCAALHTLVHRTLLARSQLFQQDWFWIALGMALFWIGFVPVPAFVQAFLVANEDWARIALMTRAWMVFISLLIISWGVLCPWILTRSFGLSLPQPLR